MNNFIPKNIEDFYLDDQSLENIKLWEKSYDKPLFIYGETGCGKSSLANIIIKNKPFIKFDTYHIKLNKNITNTIKESIESSCILSLFNNNNNNKILIFDDLYEYFQNDKLNYKNIYNLIIKKKNYPIIIISSIINYKIKLLSNKSYRINIQYNKLTFNLIINKYFKNINNYDNSSYNINIMKNNILFNSETDNISNINNIHYLFKKRNYNDIIYNFYESYYFSLNLLENLPNNILINNNYIKNIFNYYNYFLISDLFYNLKLEQLREYIIIYTIYLYHLILLDNQKDKLINNNNKYINKIYNIIYLQKLNIKNPLQLLSDNITKPNIHKFNKVLNWLDGHSILN